LGEIIFKKERPTKQDNGIKAYYDGLNLFNVTGCNKFGLASTKKSIHVFMPPNKRNIRKKKFNTNFYL
jgi:hypothetical protein